MTQSYLARLAKAIEDEDGGVFAGRDADGHLLHARYHDDRFDPPLVLDFTEEEFDAAVQTAGSSPWPGVSALEGGYRYLSVHFYESMSAGKTPSRRVYLSGGQIHAE